MAKQLSHSNMGNFADSGVEPPYSATPPLPPGKDMANDELADELLVVSQFRVG